MNSLLRTLTALLAVACITSCDTDYEVIPAEEKMLSTELIGTWQLDSYMPGLVGGVFSAKTLEYQQYYTLSADSTFRKFRSTGEEATGTFTKEIWDGKSYIVLEFLEIREPAGGFPITASCSPGRTYLYLDATGTLSDNNLACDVGNFIYKRIKEVK
jgi:hypothetical protein